MASPAAFKEPTINDNFNAFQENFTTIALVFLAQLTLLLLLLLLLVFPWVYRVTAVLKTGNFEQLFSNPDIFAPWLQAKSETWGLVNWPLLVYWTLIITSNILNVFYLAVPALYYARGQTITPDVLCNEVKKKPWRYLIAAGPFVLGSLDWPTHGRLLILIFLFLLQALFINLMVTTNGSIADGVRSTLGRMFTTPNGRSFAILNVLSLVVVLAVGFITCGFGLLLAGPTRDFYLQNLLYHKHLRS